MRVKICGITNPADGRLAAEAGADAIGLNLVAGPRRITVATAGEILESLNESILPVALLKLRAGGIGPAVRKLLEAHNVRWLQPYGQVDAAAVAQLSGEGFNCLWPFAVRGATFAAHVAAELAEADPRPAWLLLDARDAAHTADLARPWKWQWLADARNRGQLAGWPSIMLAGGLTPENVAQAIRAAGPDAVDVASGVEASPGKKDPDKLHAFVRAARSAWPRKR